MRAGHRISTLPVNYMARAYTVATGLSPKTKPWPNRGTAELPVFREKNENLFSYHAVPRVNRLASVHRSSIPYTILGPRFHAVPALPAQKLVYSPFPTVQKTPILSSPVSTQCTPKNYVYNGREEQILTACK